jgi:hypothetical protein
MGAGHRTRNGWGSVAMILSVSPRSSSILQRAEYSSRHSQRVAGQRWGQVCRNEGCEFHRLALVGRLSPGEKWAVRRR